MHTLPRPTDATTKVLVRSQFGIFGTYGGEMPCPQCSSSDCVRVKRRGWRDFIWRLKQRFPWYCTQCGHRFYHFQRR